MIRSLRRAFRNRQKSWLSEYRTAGTEPLAVASGLPGVKHSLQCVNDDTTYPLVTWFILTIRPLAIRVFD
jgi:hypothetical protein